MYNPNIVLPTGSAKSYTKVVRLKHKMFQNWPKNLNPQSAYIMAYVESTFMYNLGVDLSNLSEQNGVSEQSELTPFWER